MATSQSPVVPKSRLEDSSKANSLAIDEARRAQTAERQSMATRRSLQRQYRRAVRKGDVSTIAGLGRHMTDMGLSPLGGGGIQSAEENDRIANDRAYNRADQINQATGRGADPNGSPAEATGVANDIEAGASKVVRRVAPPAAKTVIGDTREKFIEDVGRSALFQDGDSDAIERAATRGSKFGITKEQLMVHSQDGDATPSGIAKAKADAASRKEPVFSPVEDEEPSDLMKMATGYKAKSDGLKGQIEEGRASVEAQLASNPMEDEIPEPSLPVLSRSAVADAQSARDDYAKAKAEDNEADWQSRYWNTNVADLDKNDPRYAAAKIKHEAFRGRLWGQPSKEESETSMIHQAILEGVDISGITRQDQALHSKYKKALDIQRRYDESNSAALAIRQRGSNLLPTP